MVAVCLAAVSRAEAPSALPLQLDWQAPPECAQADAVRAELARITRVTPGFVLTPLVARAEVQRTGSSYVARLETERQGERGERRLEAGDCRTLVRTVTLVLALAFGPGVELAESDTSSAAGSGAPGEAADAAESTPPPDARPPASPSASADASDDGDDAGDGADAGDDADGSSSLRLSALLGAGAQLNLLPAPAFVATAGAMLSSGALALDARVFAFPGVGKDLDDAVRARFDGLGVALLGCGRLLTPSPVFWLCAGPRAAALRGRSHGASDDGSEVAPWLALSAAAALGWPISSLVRVRLEAALSLALKAPLFVVERVGDAHRVPRATPELALLLELGPG